MTDPRFLIIKEYFENMGHRGMPLTQNKRLDELVHPDITVHDLDLGGFKGIVGWKEYNERCIRAWPDLYYPVDDEYWVNDRGVAVTWRMEATMTPYRAKKHGLEEFIGVRWSVRGMSRFTFQDGLIKDEQDFYDGQGFLRFYKELKEKQKQS